MKIKKLVPILFVLVMAFALTACAGSTESTESSISSAPSQSSSEAAQTPKKSQKQSESIVSNETKDDSRLSSEPADSAESSSGQEPKGSKILVAYFSATNNTEGVAQILADGLDADLYEIVPEQPYTDEDLDYNSDCRANREQNDDLARPAISGSVNNMDDYDIIFLGYPIWWGQAPKIMYTFVESYDLGGKIVVPFCTSGSSSIGSSATNLQSSADDAAWLDGHRFSGGADSDEVMEWANELDIN